MHILSVFGTRPEAIKFCPLIKAMEKEADLHVTTVLTGQHREMLSAVLDQFGVRGQFNLAIMRKGQTLSEVTVAVLEGLAFILEREKPDLILVQGDTVSAFAASLAAFYQGIPIGHIEAGLRTHDLSSPFPEEFDRRAISLMASWHFAPTEGARENLLSEGIAKARIFVTGNTGIDALRYTVREDYRHPLLARLHGKRILLLTAHRRENWADGLSSAFAGVRAAIEGRSDVALVFPMHKNPLVRELARASFAGCDKVHLIEPLDLIDFHNFLARCTLVLTDSGGVQEEAPYFGKPVLVLRDKTERPEGVAAGVLRLVGCEKERVAGELDLLLDDEAHYAAMSRASSPFGDGNASKRIVTRIKEIGKKALKTALAP